MTEDSYRVRDSVETTVKTGDPSRKSERMQPEEIKRIEDAIGKVTHESVKVMQETIRATYGCDSDDLGRSTFVKEVISGEVVWEGFVRHFRLNDHPQTKRCYAWSYQDGSETKTVAVLEIHPVDSPQTAVKVAIAAKARQA